MTDIHHLLQDNHHKLTLQYDTASSDVLALLDTLRDHVLPQLVLELDLPDSDVAWLSEWLFDTASIFRLYRRQRFIRPFTLNEIRTVAIWRLHALRRVLRRPAATLFHCLPPPVADPFGRPLVFLKLASFRSLPCSVKDALLQEVERLRLHLRYIRDHHAHASSPPLQYLVFVDLGGVSMQNLNLDLCSWLLTDIIPRYPGMLAAVFLLNYSWMHSGAWLVARHVLPSSIIARVFFPSKAQLLSYCSPATLPAEYGGSLPALDQIDDALRSAYQIHHLPPPLDDLPIATPAPPQPPGKNAILSFSPPPTSPLHRPPSMIILPPFSPRNPFFGYPAIASASSPHTVHHVRKGLRELMRTLAVLWWRRWKRWVWASVCAVALVLASRIYRARARARTRTAAKGLVGTTVDVTHVRR